MALALAGLPDDLLARILELVVSGGTPLFPPLLRVSRRFRRIALRFATSVTVHGPTSALLPLHNCQHLRVIRLIRCMSFPWDVAASNALSRLRHLTRLVIDDSGNPRPPIFDLPLLYVAQTLQALHLDHFTVTAATLHALARMTQLRELHFRSSTIVSESHLDNITPLPALRKLDLTDCWLLPPAEYHKVEDLCPKRPCVRRWQTLRAARQPFSMSAGFSALQSLNLHGCLVGEPQLRELRELTALQALSLSSVTPAFTREGMQHICALTSLRMLDVSRTRWPSHSLHHLSRLSDLRELDATDCLLSHRERGGAAPDAGLRHLARLQSLVSLSLSYNEDIGGAQLAALSALTALEELFVAVRWSAQPPPDWRFLARLRNLRTLDASGWAMPEASMRGVAAAASLRALKLSQCGQVTERALLLLCGLPRLRWLCLNCCAVVTDDVLRGLARTPLRELGLCGSQGFTDAGIASLGGCATLRALCVRDCAQLTDGCVAGLARGALEELDVRGCPRLTQGALARLRRVPSMQELHAPGDEDADEGAGAEAQAPAAAGAG